MEFTLVYDGELKANGTAKQKQAIRRVIHKQMQRLWNQPPLDNYNEYLNPEPKKEGNSIIKNVRGFSCAPLISEKLRLVAELDILFLRPEAPGSLITQGGDIDNRLKTLFDGLRMPKVDSEIPIDDLPQEGEAPFFCLLEDDNLITKVSVKTDRLLITAPNNNHVLLFIGVALKKVVGTWGNLGLA